MSIEMILVLDKRDNTFITVSPNYSIEYNGVKTQLKDLEIDNMKVSGVIYQENGEIDLLYNK